MEVEVENDAKSFVEEEFLAMDIEEADLLNPNIEVERSLNCGSFDACREKEQSNTSGTVKAENAENVNSVVCENESAPWVSAETMKPPPKASELKGHLTRFGLSSLKAFQLDAVNAVELN